MKKSQKSLFAGSGENLGRVELNHILVHAGLAIWEVSYHFKGKLRSEFYDEDNFSNAKERYNEIVNF